MTIKKLIDSGALRTSFEIKKCSCISVSFLTLSGCEDETELTIEHSILTEAGAKELEELFSSLAKEFQTEPSLVCGLEVIASADTIAELESAGY